MQYLKLGSVPSFSRVRSMCVCVFEVGWVGWVRVIEE